MTVSVKVAERADDDTESPAAGTTHELGGGNEKRSEKDKGKDKKANSGSGNKRKVETAEDIYAQEIGNKIAKRGKKSGKGSGKKAGWK